MTYLATGTIVSDSKRHSGWGASTERGHNTLIRSRSSSQVITLHKDTGLVTIKYYGDTYVLEQFKPLILIDDSVFAATRTSRDDYYERLIRFLWETYSSGNKYVEEPGNGYWAIVLGKFISHEFAGKEEYHPYLNYYLPIWYLAWSTMIKNNADAYNHHVMKLLRKTFNYYRNTSNDTLTAQVICELFRNDVNTFTKELQVPVTTASDIEEYENVVFKVTIPKTTLTKDGER